MLHPWKRRDVVCSLSTAALSSSQEEVLEMMAELDDV